MKKIIKFLKLIKFKKISKNNVVVMDADSAEVFVDILNEIKINPVILSTRNEVFFINLEIAAGILKFLFLNIKLLLKNFNVAIYSAYIYSCIRQIKPKIVITQFEYCPVFQYLSTTMNDIFFVAFQRSVLRYYEYLIFQDRNNFNPPRMSNFVCFGASDVSFLKKIGSKIETYHPIGSLKAGYYFSKYENCVQEFDFCIISEMNNFVFDGKEKIYLDLYEGLSILYNFVNKFCKIYKKNVCICLRGYSEESHFFKTIFDCENRIINKIDASSVYKSMCFSNIIISCCSTCCLEAFGWGKKIFCANFSNFKMHDMPLPDDLLITERNFERFCYKLTNLEKINNKEYCEKFKMQREMLMNFQKKMLPHDYLKNLTREVF